MAERSARRRRERRTDRQGVIHLRPWKHTHNPYPPIEPLSADQIEAIHQASLKILSEHGMRILSPRACELYKAAGNRVDSRS